MTIRVRLWLGALAYGAALLAVRRLLGGSKADGPVKDGVTLAVSAPVAWVLAWLAYSPVRGVTRTVRSITTTGQLDRRCFYGGPHDDVGDLVVAVNDLLVRHDAAIGRLRRRQAAAPACDCPRGSDPPDAADLVLGL
jgi:hypothetical protein